MKGGNFEPSKTTLVAILGGVVVLGGGIWWSGLQRAAADQADRQLRLQQTQWRALAASNPAPTATVVAELERRVESARGVVQSLRTTLGDTDAPAGRDRELPATRADAFFALAQFREVQRERAVAAGVVVAEGETFGFSAHRNSGPADEHLSMVGQQMAALSVALETLWTVQPEELLGVQRENPATRFDGPGSAASGREGRPEEWLVWPAERSLAEPGKLETLTFRLSWLGHTATLRAWLGALRRNPTPLVVREVAVEPLTEGGRPAGGRRTLADLFRDEEPELPAGEGGEPTIIPLIPENRSVFHVTLEYWSFEEPGAESPVGEEAATW